ncbi:MAG: SPOR domain-containing protein [Chloroflexota bacterium]
MKILSKHISNLLFEHDCVIIPGLGGFITNYRPATIHPHHNTFYPPSKQVTFNTALTGNDGILITTLASYLSVDFNEAKKIVDQKVHAIRVSLVKGQRVEFDEIGYLVSNRENNIEFHSYNSINFLSEAYGLQKFSFNPVNRDEESLINKPAIRQTMRWAAILVPVAAVALWATLNTATVSRIYDGYASLIPSTPTESVNSPVRKVTTVAKPAVKVAKPVVQQTVSKEITALNSPVIDSKVVENATSCTFHIITGAFSVPENAAKLAQELTTRGFHASVIGPNRRQLHLVSIEGFNDKETANAKMAELHKNGFPSAWLLEKNN